MSFPMRKQFQCSAGHNLLRGTVSCFETYVISSYCCYSCKQSNIGNRFICADCSCDICYKCCVETTTENLNLPMATPIHYIRIYLNKISLREQHEGIPVGILLVPRVVAGCLKNEWSLHEFDALFGKLGFKKVMELPGK